MSSKELATVILMAFAILLLVTWIVSIIDVLLTKQMERRYRKKMYDIMIEEEREKLGG